MASGELLPLATEPLVIEEQGIGFLVHIKTQNISRKFPKPAGNPFLPYEQDMYVDDAGEHHVCLLNKFPVVAPHLLVCSKTFIEQTLPLTLDDFKAWLLGIDDDECFGFYNGGPAAGASQAHRHMQLVTTNLPLESQIVSGELPFTHWLVEFDQLDADHLYQAYFEASHALGIYDEHGCKPYNLLLTNSWMLVVPRSVNNIESVFANGLNYSGRFLVNNQQQVEWLADYGMVRYLRECGIAG